MSAPRDRTGRAAGLPAAATRAAWRGLSLLGLPAGLLSLWWFVSAGSTSLYFPPLRTILEAAPAAWEGRVVTDVLPSVGRLLTGYVLALLAGVGLGTAIGLFPRLRAFCEPALELLRAIPPPVMVPVLVLLLGIHTPMKVAVVALGCLWPVLLHTIEGVRGLEVEMRETAAAYRIRGTLLLRTVILPGAAPMVVAGARQALSVGIILTVIAEMFAARDGIGFTIVQFQRSFALPEMWSGILVLGMLGVLLSLAFRAAERAVLRRHGGADPVPR